MKYALAVFLVAIVTFLLVLLLPPQELGPCAHFKDRDYLAYLDCRWRQPQDRTESPSDAM